MLAIKKDDAYRAREEAFRKGVGHRLLLARKALGKKRGEWSERYGIIASRYSQWENGVSLPDTLLLTAICADHGISLANLSIDIAKMLKRQK